MWGLVPTSAEAIFVINYLGQMLHVNRVHSQSFPLNMFQDVREKSKNKKNVKYQPELLDRWAVVQLCDRVCPILC